MKICVQNKKYRRLVSLQDTNLRYESSHGGDEESRTPVQKRCHIDLSEHSL